MFPPQTAAPGTADLAATAQRIGFPLVVKRDHSAGGTGVHILRSAAEVEFLIAISLPVPAQDQGVLAQRHVGSPDLYNHHHPWSGTPRPVADILVDRLLDPAWFSARPE